MRVILRHPASLTKDQASRAWSDGQKRYWIATEGMGHFLRIPNCPAIYPLQLEIDIPFGVYILGCGYGANKLRRKFQVDLMGVKFL